MENRNWRQDVETEGIRKIDWEEWKRHPQDTQGGCLVDDMYDVKIGCYVDAVNRSLETVRIPSERVAPHPNFDTIEVRVQNGCRRVHQGAVCAGQL